ncbi:MAG TPA: DUF1232 domain-containing protein [Candidatus Acidoferrales bacterium]|nr:DUF1232 domain-containing protein [Candidatus Acidoferrales bacterium]
MTLARGFLLLWRIGPRKVFQFLCALPKFAKLFWRLLRDERVPAAPKILLLSLVAYLLVPVDLLPDVMPGFGQLDDLALIYLGLQAFFRLCPRTVVREHVQAIAAGR